MSLMVPYRRNYLLMWQTMTEHKFTIFTLHDNASIKFNLDRHRHPCKSKKEKGKNKDNSRYSAPLLYFMEN